MNNEQNGLINLHTCLNKVLKNVTSALVRHYFKNSSRVSNCIIILTGLIENKNFCTKIQRFKSFL